MNYIFLGVCLGDLDLKAEKRKWSLKTGRTTRQMKLLERERCERRGQKVKERAEDGGMCTDREGQRDDDEDEEM